MRNVASGVYSYALSLIRESVAYTSLPVVDVGQMDTKGYPFKPHEYSPSIDSCLSPTENLTAASSQHKVEFQHSAELFEDF